MTRRLACEHCGRSFEAKRSHARFCSDSCRAAHWAKNRKNARERPGERVVEASRRPSRDGRGTKVYLTPYQLGTVLWLCQRVTGHDTVTAAGLQDVTEIEMKLAAARTRIQRKESR